VNKQRLIVIGIVLLGGGLLLADSCSRKQPVGRSHSRGAASDRHRENATVIEAITRGLNTLPKEVVLELSPPFPILDGSKSADGKEVLATCSVTPDVPGSPFNYLHVPQGNANFNKLGVRPGDLVRYYVKYELEDPEYDIPELKYLEIPVRRLDSANPQNALILDGGLSGPMPIPSRIEIWRFSDKRMKEINKRLNRYMGEKPKQLSGWEPSPDESALELLHDRLNQWYLNVSAGPASWQSDPLVNTLPKEIRESPTLRDSLTEEGQTTNLFEATDTRLLQQAVWCRDISRWAKGAGLTDLEVARTLFDWTVRNIQLDGPQTPGIVHYPWQALMYGHGNAAQRAWVFAELCRQQQLDVVIVSLAPDADSARYWLAALWSEGKLHLFDPRLGLPLPGKEPGSIATLPDILNKPDLLRTLDLEDQDVYPLSSEDLQDIEIHLVSSPLQLSRRAASLQALLEGENFIVLSANTQRISTDLAAHPQGAKVRLWAQPFQSVLDERAMTQVERQQAAFRFLTFAQRPRLWKARVLHFQGTKAIPADQRNDPLATPDLGHEQAVTLYSDDRVRPPKSILNRMEPIKRSIYSRVKIDASYWLGLLSYDLGNYSVAVNWLKNLTLEAEPNGPWTAGARYNLARTYEAMGNLEEAISLLDADDSPQSYGNRLRARQLRWQLDEAQEGQEE
jgi:tetratricopeptide (TPR) repeat protein